MRLLLDPCGVPYIFKGRRESDGVDVISYRNLKKLMEPGSPKIEKESGSDLYILLDRRSLLEFNSFRPKYL